MKSIVVIAFAATVAMTGITEAACNGQLANRTGPNGKTLSLCQDGKYSTCLRDGQRLGYSYESAKRYCDARPNLRR
jgi:hypothetical protein